MLSERHDDAVVAWAPAKVNLHLEVLARRPDGYHDIATLMVAVSLFDTLEFTNAAMGEISVCSDHPDLTTGQENLVVRAAQALQRYTGSRRGARIRLIKRIPLAGGLGGGSSDAAATLRGLNELWQSGLPTQELAGLASEVGSDVAFFLYTPAAWCTGRGERVESLSLGVVLWFVLACPPFGISTAEVYKEVQIPAKPLTGSEILHAVQTGTVGEIGSNLHNRLQAAALKSCPMLAEVSERLTQCDPVGHLLSGSGSTWFALCRDYGEACKVARGLSGPEERMSLRVFIVRSCF
jgi:4-diphosphocytidyl-2-C-methyl-D-erythritol kinase